MSSASSLRGAQGSLPPETSIEFRNLSGAPDDPIKLTQSLAFQITISILLAAILLLQLALMISFFRHRTKRVLEFAQPTIINICNVAAVCITASCYLYLYISNVGCAVREPIIFTSLTVMGASIAGRAWRISILFSPILNFGRSSTGSTERGQQLSNRMGACRQYILRFLREATGRRSAMFGESNRLQVKVSIYRTIRAVSVLVLPQILLQSIIVAVPATRSKPQMYQQDEMILSTSQCQSDSGQGWYITFSILFTCIPFVLAWILNLRPKNELDKLPEMVDERNDLQQSFWTTLRVVITSSPLIGMSMAPNAYAYATICTVLSLPLSICYYVSYSKLTAIDGNATSKKYDFRASNSDNGRNSVAHAVRMAEMYVKIGRVEETVQLVEETLSVWRKGSGGQNAIGFGGREDGEEIGSGFTKSDLASLEPEELELIIQLLKIKGQTLITLYGHQTGSGMYAKLHVDILKIFENCPASAKLKDSSIIFPVYNYLGLQIRGGAFAQDDLCSLEVDLAERFHYEAQVQSYHLARALANLADVCGRTGHCEDAFKYFDVMQSIYMSEHAAKLNDTYAVDRCAVCIATSALWYLQLGKIEEAIERCDFVAQHVLPTFNESDTIGKYHSITSIIRVLKWNNHVDRARELYERHIPDGTENHFAVGSIHKPMSLLLKICEGSSVNHSITDSDIDLALNYEINDFSDNIFTSDGWSMNSLGAELCLHLARRLKSGEIARGELVKKGIQLSSVADSRVKASNGLVKHILAYEAHRAVYLDLLALAGLDAKMPRKNIFDVSMNTTKQSHSTSVNNPGTDRDIVKRLVLKEEPSAATGQTVGSSSGESKLDSIEKSRKSRQAHISKRLFYRDVSSGSSKLSGSGFSFGSATSSKGDETGSNKMRKSSRISEESLPSIASLRLSETIPE